MPDKCCVPLCCSNYEKKANKKNINTDIVSVYKFPKSENERSAWVKSIPRVNLNVTKHIVVCRKHWPKDAPLYVVPGGRKRKETSRSAIYFSKYSHFHIENYNKNQRKTNTK